MSWALVGARSSHHELCQVQKNTNWVQVFFHYRANKGLSHLHL